MSVGDVSFLGRVDWDWFVSCTVAKREASDVYLKKKAFALIRSICRTQHVHFLQTPFALRIESGRDPRHRHFHFLIGGLTRTSVSERFRTMACWTALLGGMREKFVAGSSEPVGLVPGTCRVRLYDGASGLASYLTKTLNASEVWGWCRAEGIIVSHAAGRCVRRNVRMIAVR